MSYHHWSNARGAGRRTYDGQMNRANMSRFNHSSYQHQQGNHKFRHGMRDLLNLYNEAEGLGFENHDLSNEYSKGYHEAQRNGASNGNGSTNVGADSGGGNNGYRNYFTRHRVSQDGAFRGNLQMWHTRIFTRSDHNTPGSYVPGQNDNRRKNSGNSFENYNHDPLYSDIAGNGFSRENYFENGGNREGEQFNHEVAPGHIAPNVGYIGVSRFRTQINFIQNFNNQTNVNETPKGISTPTENICLTGKVSKHETTLPVNLNHLNGFPSLASTIRGKNNGNNRNVTQKQPDEVGNIQKIGTTKPLIETKTEKQSLKTQGYKKTLDQNQDSNVDDQILAKLQKQENKQQYGQKQQKEMIPPQFYQQLQCPLKDPFPNQVSEQAYLAHAQQQCSKQIQGFHQKQLFKNLCQNQFSQQQIETQPNATSPIFRPMHHQTQVNLPTFHQDQTNAFTDSRSKQQQLQLREFEMQQQQNQQLCFFQFQQQAAHQQFQHLQSQPYLHPPIQPDNMTIIRPQNGHALHITRPHYRLPPKPSVHQFSSMFKTIDKNKSSKGAKIDQNPSNTNLAKSTSIISASTEFPALALKVRDEKSLKFLIEHNQSDNVTLRTLKSKSSQCQFDVQDFHIKAQIEMFDKSQQTDERIFQNESSCKELTLCNEKQIFQTLPNEDIDLEVQVLDTLHPQLSSLVPSFTKPSKNFPLEHFPALPRRSQLSQIRAISSVENIARRYVYCQQSSYEEPQNVRNTFSSILISSQGLNTPSPAPALTKPVIFNMRMEDFPALPSMKSRISKSINCKTVNNESPESVGQPNAKPLQKIETPPLMNETDVDTFFARLEKHCKAKKEKSDVEFNGTYTPPRTTLKFWPNDLIFNIPPTMLTDQYGIAGLYSVNKAAETDPHIARMTYGINLENLGLDLRSKQPLLPKFKGPFADKRQELFGDSNDFPICTSKHLSDDFNTNTRSNDTEGDIDNFSIDPDVRDSLASPDMEILSDGDLFYIFYTYVQDLLQLKAANELYNRAWVFYIKEKIWITHDQERSYQQNGRFERGYYICYDHEESKCVLKFMKIDIAQIDDRPTIPLVHRNNPNSSPN